jgi:hypothetical protein
MRRYTRQKRNLRIAILCTVLALSALPGIWVSAQEEEARYFPETEHNVSGAFLAFYDLHGGRAIFGYPLTRPFEEDGRLVQYFQRARMELHRDAQGERVELGLLGQELGHSQPPIPASEIPPPTHPDKRYFGETGHTVSFTFLQFYQDKGGVERFGYPITEWIIEPNGSIVQYFQKSKMAWYPENPPGQRVQLGMLGTIYVEQHVDPIYKEREPPYGPSQTPVPVTPTPGSVPEGVTEVRMMSTLKRPVIGSNGKQTVYVYVFDQQDRGVPGASVDIEVQYQDGRTEPYALAGTNANGYSQLEFEVGSPPPGLVVIVNLNARYGDLAAQTSTAFLPWW